MRSLRKGELTAKDMTVLREGAAPKSQHKKPSQDIRDYSLQHTIKMLWGDDFKEKIRDLRPFYLQLDGKRYLLSWGELKDLDSAGFFRRDEPNAKSYRLRWFDGPKFVVDVNLNEEAKRDVICRFSGEGFEVLIDWYEMMRAGRFI